MFENKFLDITLRKKLILVFIVIALLPAIFLGYYSYHTVNTELINQMNVTMGNDINQINKNIENNLQFYAETSSLMYLDLNLKNYLTIDYKENDYLVSYEYINHAFKSMTPVNNKISSITIYTNNLTLPSDGLYIKPIDYKVKNTFWYKNVMKSSGNTFFSNTSIDSTGSYSFMLYRLLNYQSINYPYGILTLVINESELYSLIDKENTYKDVFITSKDGTIISYKDKSLIGKNLSTLLNNDEILNGRSGHSNAIYKNSKVLLMYNSMNNGWKTIAIIPYNKFLKNAQLLSIKILFVYFIVIMLASFLIYFTSKLLTKRIEILVTQIKKVEVENFNIHLPNMGNDEIGQLSNAFEKMTVKLNTLIEEVYKKELLKKEAEMGMLQAQINPHFLYNTLASISALALRQRDDAVNEMVLLLSKFYRISLNNGKNVLSIEEEFILTKYYVAIQQIRFKDLLHLYFNIPENLYIYKTPKLILQPFIENAINHAIWNQDLGITVVINVYVKDDNICFDIIDNGIGINKIKLSRILDNMDTTAHGFGIKNVDDRIKLYFGEEYGVQVLSRPGMGTTVKIIIPKEI